MKPGTLLHGKYRLLSPIAEGESGDVWTAEHQGLDMPVAVKVLHDGVASSSTLRARFDAEAKTAARLRSPHVVQVFDVGVDEATQTPFVVMELLGGESLRDRIERQGRLPVAEVARIVTHVARALGRAHEMSVLHGALEPSRIFLVRNGDKEMAKVLGFGKRHAAASADTTVAVPATQYISPEQIRDSQSVDARTDLWSLGVIAFECMTGQPPFVAETASDLALRICHREARQASELVPVPAGFDAWFQRATALSPDERFASAAEMAAALMALCGASNSIVPGAVMAATLFEPPQLRPSVTLAPPPLPAELMPAPPPLPAELMPAPLGARAPKSGRRWPLAAAGVLLLGGAAFAFLTPPKEEPLAPVVAAQPVVQEVQQIRPSTGIRVFGEGPAMTLLVDGKEFGPLPRELQDLEPGEHVIQVTGGPRYEVFQQRIVVEPERITPIGPIRLRVTRGLATITAGAGAEEAEVMLQVGDSRRVLPELPVRLEVETEQPHVLTARRKGYETFEEEITFEDGQAQKTIEINLTEGPTDEPRRRRRSALRASNGSSVPRSERNEAPEKVEAAAQEPARQATLTLRSIPPSNVILDGKPLGPTPRSSITVEPGTHRIIFIHGDSRKTETVEAAPGSNQTVSVNF